MKDRVTHAARGLAGTAVLLLALLARNLASACVEDAAVGAPGLRPWERELLRDCDPASRLGDVRPFDVQDAVGGTARAHVLLGPKALHNFFYDLCKYEFDRARLRPDGAVGILGKGARAAHMERRGRERLAVLLRAPNATDSPDSRERLYFEAVWTLNAQITPLTEKTW